MIAHDSRVVSVIMFGHHHIDTGILVEPAPGNDVDPSDRKQVEEFISMIWCVLVFTCAASTVNIIHSTVIRPTIEKANTQAPEYARVNRNVSRRNAIIL